MTPTAGGPGGHPAPGAPELRRCAFSTRAGGVSRGPYESLNLADHVGDDPAAVSTNRDRLAARAGLRGTDLAVMGAAHGRDAAVVTAPGVVASVDILVTTDPDLGLVALAADCVPIALVDRTAGVAAAVHSGWRGVAVDAVGAAVAVMVAQGARPASIAAHLGPAICPACYEVSAEVRDQVAAAAPSAAATTAASTPAVAMHAAVGDQLRRAGVSRISADPRCTAEDPQLFSYRRDGVTGRQGVVVRLPAGEGS